MTPKVTASRKETVMMMMMMMMMMMVMNFFAEWLTGKRRLALFQVETTVRDSHYPSTDSNQDLTYTEPEFRLCQMKLCRMIQTT